MRSEKLRAMFERKELFAGTHCQIAEPIVTEIVCRQGFDFLWIDTEHSAIDRKDLNTMILAAHAADVPVFVRVTYCDPNYAKPILEMDPDGIIFPNVRNVEEAKLAVAAVRYPPEGIRGYGPQRANGYGEISNADWVGKESKKVWCIPQIEDYRAIDNLEAILAVPGIDALMIGPNDMSGSMGKLAQLSDPEVQRYFDMYVAKAKAAGVPVGTSFGYGGNDDSQIREWIKRGVDYICVGSDMSYLASGARTLAGTIRGIAKEVR